MPSSTSKKKPTDRKPKTTNYGSSWRTPLHDLELPSGEVCQAKRPGVQGLVKAGVLHSLDSLTSIVQSETIPKAEGKPLAKDKSVQAIMEDPDKFNKMMEQTDKIVMFVVVQPKIHPNTRPVMQDIIDDGVKLGEEAVMKDGEPVLEEIPLEERDPELVYIDYIDPMDKMYIMNFAVGGSVDLQSFRAQAQASMGGVPTLESPEDAS
jgi:hypothetical protein